MGAATDGGVQFVESSTVDPLKKLVTTKLRDPIPGKQSWVAFQIIVHAFAAANDCAIQSIRKIDETTYVIEVLVKNIHRLSSKDPFVDDWKSNSQKRREEFHRYLRDKAEELKKDLKDEPEPTAPLPSDINQWCR